MSAKNQNYELTAPEGELYFTAPNDSIARFVGLSIGFGTLFCDRINVNGRRKSINTFEFVEAGKERKPGVDRLNVEKVVNEFGGDLQSLIDAFHSVRCNETIESLRTIAERSRRFAQQIRIGVGQLKQTVSAFADIH